MMPDAELNYMADRIAAELLVAEILTVEAESFRPLHPNTIWDQAPTGELPGLKFGKCCCRCSPFLDTITSASVQGSRVSWQKTS